MGYGIDRTVDGSSPTSVKTFLFGTLAIPFTPLCQCLSDETVKAVGPFRCGVYARGSKRPHQSALECVIVVDSTSHSKPPRSASMRLKKLPCTDKGRRRLISSVAHFDVCEWVVESTTSCTFQCGLVGYFTSPGIDTR